MKKYLMKTTPILTCLLLFLSATVPLTGNSAIASDSLDPFMGLFSIPVKEAVAVQKLPALPPTIIIGNLLWFDENGNGVRDAGEPGLKNAEIQLWTVGQGGNPDAMVATTFSDANGNYAFRRQFEKQGDDFVVVFDIAPGTYYVDVVEDTVPAALALSAGSDPSENIVAQEGGSYLDVDFGYANANPAAVSFVGDLVWRDVDGDGIRDPGEPGIGGVTLDLVGPGADGVLTTADDVVLHTAVTDNDGSYYFPPVEAGLYMVDVTDTSDVLADFTLVGGWDPSDPFTVGDGLEYLNADFGYWRAEPTGDYEIKNRIWFDEDADGVFDPDEKALRGVTANLVDGSGEVVATEIAFADETIVFAGVPDGTYTIVVTDVRGELQGAEGTTEAAVVARLDVVVNGGDVSGDDFGYVFPGTIAGWVFSDADGDAEVYLGEVGIEGVNVELYRDDGDGSFEPGGDDVFVDSVQTGANGAYFFESLTAGLYFASIPDGQTVLADYVLSSEDDAPGADGAQALVQINGGAGLNDVNFAFFNDASPPDISGNIWNDYSKDGVSEIGERPLDGVIVVLEKDVTDGGADPDWVIASLDITDNLGDYAFPDAGPGWYRVNVIDNFGRLQGFVLTSEDTIGPEPSERFQLAAENVVLDFGFVREPRIGIIGDTVWHDLNANAAQDEGEPGISGAILRLYNQGRDAERGTADDFIVSTAITDGLGNYWFTELPAGNYYVVVDNVPGNFVPSPGMSDESRLVNMPIPLDTPPDDLESVTVDDIDFGFVEFETPPDLPDLGNTSKSVRDLDGGDLLENDVLEYTVVIYNSGDGRALDVVYDDVPDANTTLLVGTVSTTRGLAISGNRPGDTAVRVNVGHIDSRRSVTIKYSVRVNEGTPDGTMIVNQGIVNSDNFPPEPTDFPGTGTRNDPTVIGPVVVFEPPPPPESEIAATKTWTDANGDKVRAGDRIDYEIRISNLGQDPARNLVFSDSVPMHTIYVAASLKSTQGVVSEGPPLLVNIGDLEANATVVITYGVIIDPDTVVGTVIENQGVINGDNDISVVTDDPDSDDPDDPTQIIVEGDPNLEVFKSAVDVNGELPRPGDILEYTLRTTNAGNDAATGVVLFDTPSDLVSLVAGSVSTTAGTVTRGNNENDESVEVDIGEIEPGVSVTVVYRAEISLNAQDGDQVVNQGIVASNELDDKPSDDPSTGTPGDPTVITIVDPHLAAPEAYMTVSGDRPDILWQMQWINQEATGPVLARIYGPIPETTAYVEGSLQVSTGSAVYDAENDRIVWNGVIPGNGGEVLVSYETTVSETVDRVENQGVGVWDENGNGSVEDEIADGGFAVLTDDPNTPEEDDPTVWYAPILPPDAYKTVYEDNYQLFWEIRWVNDDNLAPIVVHMEDPLPANSPYVVGSLQASSGAAFYDEAENKIVWDGEIPGSGGEVVITFRTSTVPTTQEVENQGFGYWDEDGDGDWQNDADGGQTPILTDDPDTPEVDDSTVWVAPPCTVCGPFKPF